MWRKNKHFKSIDSTSAYLLRRGSVLKDFSTVTADHQTAGRGREGRAWESERGKNLLFSVLIKDAALVERYAALSPATALAVMHTLAHYGVENATFKWPNDVYVGGKKICGILLQSVAEEGTMRSLVIGVGLNVNQTVFSPALCHPTTSMLLERGRALRPARVRARLCRELYRTFRTIAQGNTAYLAELRAKNELLGRTVYAEINGEKAPVRVIDLADDCSLVVEHNGARHRLRTGEITFHI